MGEDVSLILVDVRLVTPTKPRSQEIITSNPTVGLERSLRECAALAL